MSFFWKKNNPISHETISHQQLNPTLILRQKLKMNRFEINFLIPARPSYRHIKWFDCLFLMAGLLPCLALRNKIYMSYKDQFKVCRARKINNYVTMWKTVTINQSIYSHSWTCKLSSYTKLQESRVVEK